MERIRRVSATQKKPHDNSMITDWVNQDRAKYSQNIFDLFRLTRKISTMRTHKEKNTSQQSSKKINISAMERDLEKTRMKNDSKENLVRDPTPVGTSDVPEMHTFKSSERHSDTSPQDLSERWFISIGQAAQTLKILRKIYFAAPPFPSQEDTEPTGCFTGKH